jgi:hypothetical protein
MKILVIREPDEYFNLLGANVSDQYILKNEMADLINLFAKNATV